MQTMKNLIKSNGNKKLGNHRKEVVGSEERYIYYNTCIASVNHAKRVIILDKSYGTSSTTRAVNSYKNEFDNSVYSNYKMLIIE